MKSTIIFSVFVGSLYLTMIMGSSSSSEKDINVKIVHSNGIKDSFHANTEPFQKILDKYYYIETKEKVNWFQALNKCRELGGDFVHLESGSELDALMKQIDKSKCFWIDLNDHAERSKFKSIVTGKSPSFVRWIANEPNNLYGNERCVQLWSEGQFAMNDNVCSELCFFICETKFPIQMDIIVW